MLKRSLLIVLGVLLLASPVRAQGVSIRSVEAVQPLALQITTTSPLPSYIEDVEIPDPVTLTVIGGTPPYENFVVDTGALPTGVTLDPDTGELAGTPTTAGTYNFCVTVDDAVETLNPCKAFVWVIEEADADLPAPWVESMIGSPTPPCTESATHMTGTFTLVGCGFSYGIADTGNSIQQSVNGNYEFIANVTSCGFTGTPGLQECGIRVRQSLQDNVATAFCGYSDVDNGYGSFTEWRASQGGTTASAVGTLTETGWVRLRVINGTPDCDQSTNGTVWTDMPMSGVPSFSDPYHLMLWVDSNNGGTTTGVFEDVTVTEIVTEDSGCYRPHIEGFACTTSGGRTGGTRIGRITSLLDTASPTWAECVAGGTVRDCLATPVGCDDYIGTPADCARFVLSNVSGVATLGPVGTVPENHQVLVTAPYLTFAMQTAPVGTEGSCLANCGVSGTGLAITGGQIKIMTHDIVFQHTMLMYTDWRGCGGTIRPPSQGYGTGNCPIGTYQWSIGEPIHGGVGNAHIYNVILDHCGSVWNIAATGATNISEGVHDFQAVDCLWGEPIGWLADGGYSFQTERFITNIQLQRNLFTNSWGRHPTVGVGGNYFGTSGGFPCGYPCAPRPWYQRMIWANNIVYNGTNNFVDWSGGPVYGFMSWIFRADTIPPAAVGETDDHDLVLVGNNWIAGPDSGTPGGGIIVAALQSNIDSGFTLYMDDNDDSWGCVTAGTGDGQFGCVNTGNQGMYGPYNAITGTGSSISVKSLSPPAWYTPLTGLVSNFDTTNLRTYITANVGPFPSNRNAEVTRMIGDITDGGGDNELDPDDLVMPTHRNASRVCTPPINPNTVFDSVGRTRIEAWLEGTLVGDDGDNGTAGCDARRLEPAN